MANIKSAAKRARQAVNRRQRNRTVRRAIHTVQIKFRAAVAAGEKDKAVALMRKLSALLDSAAHKGIITKNKAARTKSRAAARLAGLSTAGPTAG